MKRQLAVFGSAAMLVALALPSIVAAASTQAVEGRVIAGHGTLLVASSNQMTVYTFDKDVAGSGTSTCTGGCLATWPALTVAAGSTPTGGAGVTGTLGTIVRTDTGTTQVTYNGLPLYFFANDKAPGDTNGIYTNWRAIVLAAEATPTPAATQGPAAATPAATQGPATTPPPTSTAYGRRGSSTHGDPLPLLLLVMAAVGALALVAAIRRLSAARR
jgi:predicted lipoprotein with Yx(FWY)xxD motif